MNDATYEFADDGDGDPVAGTFRGAMKRISQREMQEFIKTATRQETTDPETGYAIISYVNEETGVMLIYDVVTPLSQTALIAGDKKTQTRCHI